MPNFKPDLIGRFPYWADANAAARMEAVGDKQKTVVPIPIPPYYYYSDQIETIEDHSSADPVSPDTLDYSDANSFPWEQWSQLPKVEREAELREAQKEAVMNEATEKYASWTNANSATETEAIGHHGGPHPLDPGLGQSGESILQESGMDGLRESDPLTAAADVEAVGNSDVTPISRFPYWADAESATATEANDHHSGPDPLDPESDQTDESILKESGMDGLRESDPLTAAADSLTGESDESTGNFTSTVRRFFNQSDSVTGDGLANADADSSGWFQMHHDDGIRDGYLDVDSSAFDSITGAQPDDVIHTPNGSIITGLNPDNVVKVNASGFDSFLLQSGSDLIAPIAEPFADAAAITDLVTGKSSPMETAIDPLVAAGPLDPLKVDEPQNNDF